MISAVLMLIFLIGLILLVVEKREVEAIFEDEKKKGILIAENIIQLNLKPFLFWDEEGIRENIENEINEKLVYIVFYNREGNSFVANNLAKENEDIYKKSNLEGEVREGDYVFQSRMLEKNKYGHAEKILEVETPIFTEGTQKKWGSIKIGLSLEDVPKQIRETRLMLIFIGGCGLFIGILGAYLLAKRITNPLNKLVEGTIKVSRGNFSQKIEIESKDEIGDLAHSFNEMSHQLLLTKERVELANRKLIQAEKLASNGRMSAGIAHEIRNPLTSVKLNIQKLSESTHLDEVEKDHLSIAKEGISQIESFVKEFLNFSRVYKLNLNMFSIEQIMEESIRTLSDSLDLKRITLKRDYQKDLPQVRVDGDKMRQVFLNILRNAYEAVDEGGKINVSLSQIVHNHKEKIQVEISDDGIGIPEKDWENIFEPFYTTKYSGFGLGLGLARKIIEQHNGLIRVKKKEGKGSAFEIIIPGKDRK